MVVTAANLNRLSFSARITRRMHCHLCFGSTVHYAFRRRLLRLRLRSRRVVLLGLLVHGTLVLAIGVGGCGQVGVVVVVVVQTGGIEVVAVVEHVEVGVLVVRGQLDVEIGNHSGIGRYQVGIVDVVIGRVMMGFTVEFVVELDVQRKVVLLRVVLAFFGVRLRVGLRFALEEHFVFGEREQRMLLCLLLTIVISTRAVLIAAFTAPTTCHFIVVFIYINIIIAFTYLSCALLGVITITMAVAAVQIVGQLQVLLFRPGVVTAAVAARASAGVNDVHVHLRQGFAYAGCVLVRVQGETLVRVRSVLHEQLSRLRYLGVERLLNGRVKVCVERGL